jgi:hypothetical protein
VSRALGGRRGTGRRSETHRPGDSGLLNESWRGRGGEIVEDRRAGIQITSVCDRDEECKELTSVKYVVSV